MEIIKFKGNPVELLGDLPKIGQEAPDFILIREDLSQAKLSDFGQEYIVLNIFPSLDTGVCASSIRQFNKELIRRENIALLCISKDLPFAQKRFCEAEGLKKPISLSDFRDEFLSYGLKMTSGPLKGLLARAVLVLDAQRKLIYKEVVNEITNEPNYKEVLKIFNN